MLEAMRAGVNEGVAERHAGGSSGGDQPADCSQAADRVAGKAFAFVGAKGGVGATTIAVNVATALAKLEPGNVLLIDLHVANGDAAVFFGAEPRFTIVEALENTHRLDEAFFRSLVVRTKCGVDCWPRPTASMSSPVDLRRDSHADRLRAQHYRHIVLDVPRSDAAVLDALETRRASSSWPTRNCRRSAARAGWRPRCGSATEKRKSACS